MRLDKNKEYFRELIDRSNKFTGINRALIEKDYYVTLLLKTIFMIDSNFVFKGGTSLSKCFKVIDRFSEDIDLNYNPDVLLGKGTKKRNMESVQMALGRCGLRLTNPYKIKPYNFFNIYIASYDNIYADNGVKTSVVVETAYQVASFPNEKKMAQSIIGEYLESIGRMDLVEEFELEKFEVTVQSLKRTMIDKIFAICDYYLSDRIQEHSRHLYDLYKLYPLVNIDDDFYELFEEVRTIRKESEICHSAKDDISPRKILEEIIAKDIYKFDFNRITLNLLYEQVSYEDTIDNLNKIKEIIKR